MKALVLALLVASSPAAPKLEGLVPLGQGASKCDDGQVVTITGLGDPQTGNVYIRFERGAHVIGVVDRGEGTIWVTHDHKWYPIGEVVEKYGPSACDLPDGTEV